MSKLFKRLTQGLAVAVLALFSALALAAPAKVVYHVDFNDVTRYSATLTSVNNILAAYENELRDYEVTMVFVGHGIVL